MLSMPQNKFIQPGCDVTGYTFVILLNFTQNPHVADDRMTWKVTRNLPILPQLARDWL